jgi:hypothetical protein
MRQLGHNVGGFFYFFDGIELRLNGCAPKVFDGIGVHTTGIKIAYKLPVIAFFGFAGFGGRFVEYLF